MGGGLDVGGWRLRPSVAHGAPSDCSGYVMQNAPRQPKILVIDDGPTVLFWVRKVLGGAGYEVVTQDRPIGGGAAVVRDQPDLVLVDLEMPGLQATRSSPVSSKLESGSAPWWCCTPTCRSPRSNAGPRVWRRRFPAKNGQRKGFFAQDCRFFGPQPAAIARGRARPLRGGHGRGECRECGAAEADFSEFPELNVRWAENDSEAAALASSRRCLFAVLSIEAGGRAEELRTLTQLRTSGTPVILFGPPAEIDAVRAANALGRSIYLPCPGWRTPFARRCAKFSTARTSCPANRPTRRGPRLRVPIVVDYSGAAKFSATTWDICELGAFLCTDKLVKVGDVGVLRIMFPGLSVPARNPGPRGACSRRACRHLSQGLGISFDWATAAARERLARALMLK